MWEDNVTCDVDDDDDDNKDNDNITAEGKM